MRAFEQRRFIGLFGQLRLAQLDQSIHQGIVALGAQMKQAFVYGATIADRSVEHLTTAIERVAQALPGQDHALLAHQPEVLIDARALSTSSRMKNQLSTWGRASTAESPAPSVR